MSTRYDVFLSHSSADKPAVEEIVHKLRESRARQISEGRGDSPIPIRLTWADFRSGLDDEEARFLAGIRREAPGGKPPRPFLDYHSMAPPPQGLIHRKEYDRVVEALCAENPQGFAIGITTALRGAG